ncbi:MAG: alpha/beta hydrolase family protein, partial [Chthoniobacterales bacterium]
GKDDKVPLDQSQTLVKRLKEAGVPEQLVVFEKAGHDGPDFQDPLIMGDVTDFLDGIWKTKP